MHKYALIMLLLASNAFAIGSSNRELKFQANKFTMPTADGSSGQYLGTNGTKVLTFSTPSSSSGATFFGTAIWDAATGCSWSNNSTTYANFPADTDCGDPTVTGGLTAPASKIPGVVLDIDAYSAYCFYAVGIMSVSSTGNTCALQFHDGTNGFGFGQTDSSAWLQTPIVGCLNNHTALAISGVTVQIQEKLPSGYCYFDLTTNNKKLFINVTKMASHP